MSIKHHPTDETLGAYAAGTLDEGSALVVAAHVSLCPRCTAAVRGFEEVGGALLDRLQPSAMSGDALKRTLARLDEPAPPAPALDDAVAPEDRHLPRPLVEGGVTIELLGFGHRGEEAPAPVRPAFGYTNASLGVDDLAGA